MSDDRLAAVLESGSRARLVLADAEPDLRFLTRFHLENDGRFEVVGEAGDGEEAVAMAQTLQPHAAVLDMTLPLIGGLEAVPLIKDAVPGIAVALYSASLSEQARTRALALGALYMDIAELPHAANILTASVTRNGDWSDER